MTDVKVFVQQDGKATIVCRRCGRHRTVDTEKILGKRRRANIRCQCGHVFKVHFEPRSSFRKKDTLFGNLKKAETKGKPIAIVVEDLSQSGFRFRTESKHDLAPGDLVYLEFGLQDARKSLIRSTCRVRWVDGKRVGVKIEEMSQPDTRALTFYLMQ